MKQGISVVLENRQLAGEIYKVAFSTEQLDFTRPAQFMEIELEDNMLARLPVCEYDSDRYTAVYRADNEALVSLSKLEIGTELVVRTGIGEGFDVDAFPDGAVLMAQDMGIPVMLGMARQLLMQGKDYRIILGYNSKSEIFMRDVFRPLCSNLEIVTLDGSNGRQGFVYDVLRSADYVCAAATLPIITKIRDKYENGQFLEV